MTTKVLVAVTRGQQDAAFVIVGSVGNSSPRVRAGWGAGVDFVDGTAPPRPTVQALRRRILGVVTGPGEPLTGEIAR